MEYITVLCVTYSDETPTKKAMYTYASSELAIKGAYQYMGLYMASDNVASVCAVAMNSIGGIYKNEHWTAPAPVEEVEDEKSVQ